jgi:hypothetical protein
MKMKKNIFKMDDGEVVFKDKSLPNKFYLVTELEHKHMQEILMSSNRITEAIITVRDMVEVEKRTEGVEVLCVYEVQNPKRSGISIDRLVREYTE